jgi:hypothetical protein
MNHSPRAAAAIAGLSLVLAVALSTGASASDHRTVDQSLLQPALLSRFAPWDCAWRNSGPVCVGEFHETGPWELTDLPCAVPVYGARTEHRYQRLFFDEQYRNYERQNRTRDLDEFSTSPGGPATGAIATNVRYSYDFDVPGDLNTATVTSTGVIFKLGPNRGPAILQVVGTLVESWPFDEPGTFTGHVTLHGKTTLYEDQPLNAFLDDETFVNLLCEAATGEPAVSE